MYLLTARGWPARLLLSAVLTVVGLTAFIALGQHFWIIRVILLAPGAVIGILLLGLIDMIGLSAALIEYAGEEGPVVYMLLSVLCMIGFWWLVSLAAVTWWMRPGSKPSE